METQITPDLSYFLNNSKIDRSYGFKLFVSYKSLLSQTHSEIGTFYSNQSLDIGQ